MKYIILAFSLVTSSVNAGDNIDFVVSSERVFNSDKKKFEALDVAVCGKKICAIAERGSFKANAKKYFDYGNKVISPGFIDPHTHSLSELSKYSTRANLNYLTQGVTTVINGNDGKSPESIAKTAKQLLEHGIGTNVAFFIGHNTVRNAVMGQADRKATLSELKKMKMLVEQNMQAGALGLSTGLYYLPGTFASTEEVVELAKIAAEYQGIYETHLRDESTFNIGFLNAIKEAIAIAEQAKMPLHLGHIKALGVDVWGQSAKAIELVQAAQKRGVKITADQYPWLASGTSISGAVVPSWVREGGKKATIARLNDKTLYHKIHAEITENIRRRGGAERLLITVTEQPNISGQTLAEVAKSRSKSPADTVIELAKGPVVKVASFNMSEQDVINFMVKPWVVTSSDGSNGHPRKYASFPKKLKTYVLEQQLMTLETFLFQSTTATANVLNIDDRGAIRLGLNADLIIFEPTSVKVNASFKQWNILSTGFNDVFINGQHVVQNGNYNGLLAGEFVKPHTL